MHNIYANVNVFLHFVRPVCMYWLACMCLLYENVYEFVAVAVFRKLQCEQEWGRQSQQASELAMVWVHVFWIVQRIFAVEKCEFSSLIYEKLDTTPF